MPFVKKPTGYSYEHYNKCESNRYISDVTTADSAERAETTCSYLLRSSSVASSAPQHSTKSYSFLSAIAPPQPETEADSRCRLRCASRWPMTSYPVFWTSSTSPRSTDESEWSRRSFTTASSATRHGHVTSGASSSTTVSDRPGNANSSVWWQFPVYFANARRLQYNLVPA